MVGYRPKGTSEVKRSSKGTTSRSVIQSVVWQESVRSGQVVGCVGVVAGTVVVGAVVAGTEVAGVEVTGTEDAGV